MPLTSENMVPAVPGRVVALAAGAAVAAGLGVAAARALLKDGPPTDAQWRRVGRLTQLHMYPLKSGKAISESTFLATESGLRKGALRDRVFVAVDRNGHFVSGRSHPRLLHVDVSVVPKSSSSSGDADDADDVLFEFRSPGVPAVLTLDHANLVATATKKISIWGASVSAVDCGDEAAAWIRKAVVQAESHGEATPAADLRLAFYPLDRTDRGPAAPRGQRGIYSDNTSYLVMTTASLDMLNEKLSNTVSITNFRPNFLVDGPTPFEEDGWSWLRIGDKAVFKVVMPCGRCILTTVDPETGIKSADAEPLKTLRKFRKPNEEQKRKMGSDSPMLGMRLGSYQTGRVSVGDEVYVAS